MNSRLEKTLVGQKDVPDVPGDDSPDDRDSMPSEFDDGPWEAFLPDAEQFDPLPEPGDFWIESDQLNSRSSADLRITATDGVTATDECRQKPT